MKTNNKTQTLCIDLDGTLIKTDLLHESLLELLKSNLLYLFSLVIWFFKGKAVFKSEIASRVSIDASTLPYNQAVIELIRKEKSNGRRVILITGSNEKLADLVQEHLQLFDKVVGSSAVRNMTGKDKAEYLINEFGESQFIYAGNSYSDLPVWKASQQAIVVDPPLGLKKQLRNISVDISWLSEKETSALTIPYALRLHQWLKNLLLFCPLVLAHKANDMAVLADSFLAFLAFSLCASAVYLINDLLDIPSDRQHAIKSQRAIASGLISIPAALGLCGLLLLASSLICYHYLPLQFSLLLGFYFCTTLLYSYKLKNFALVDVLILAILYTLRIIGGAYAIDVVPSFWLLAFSMFLFFSLALVKRYSEIKTRSEKGEFNDRVRGYIVGDNETLALFGIVSGFMAVMVLALYIDSTTIKELYTFPTLIWLLCPLLLYWVSRIWLLTRRGQMNEDPLLFAAKDTASFVIGVIGLIIIWLAA